MATDLWGSLIKSGYRVVYGLQIDGIPYVFGARAMYAMDGTAVAAPSGYTVSHALVVREGMRVSVECDREKGLAAGRAVDFVIGRQQIADEGLGPILFARPTLRATLTAAVDNPAATTFNVDSTTGWGSTGAFYIGREYCTYSGKTGTTYTGATRGVAGNPHYHTASTYGAYRQCTNTPMFWRGRLVTLWRHLVGPDGRFLGDTWCELGDYCDQEWRGFVRDTPRPTQEGMTLTCLPLVRLGAMEFGADLQGKLARDNTIGLPLVVVENTSTIFIDNPSLSGKDHPTKGFDDVYSITSIANWAALVEASINADDGGWRCQVGVGADGIVLSMPEEEQESPTAAGPFTRVIGNAWFLAEGDSDPQRHSVSDSDVVGYLSVEYYHWLRYRWDAHPGGYNRGSWIVMRVDQAEEAEDVVLDEAGLLALDMGNGYSEVCRYSATRTSPDGSLRAFRIASRNIAAWGESQIWSDGGESTDPFRNDTTIRVIGGAMGEWPICLRTILTSSGTGDRGPYDTLPYGFGGGLPDSWIASSLTDIPGEPINALTPGRTSVEALLCGWLAIARMCLVQRRDRTGAIVLDVVSTDVTDDTEAIVIADDDVLLDGHDTPDLIEAPNHIKIEAATKTSTDVAKYIIRDAARAQAEGVRSMSFSAPGITSERAHQLGGEMLLLGDGQALVRIRLPPWVDVEPGDPVEITTAHPAIWDWSAGEFAPASVLGRVTVWERDLYTQGQEIECLLAGQAQERINLCPAALIIDVAAHSTATLLHVARGDSFGFRAGDGVLVYERTNEDADFGLAEVVEVITDVTYDAGVTYYDTIEIDADPAVTGTELVITYADYGDCVTRQQRHMFAQAGKDWR